MIPGETNLPFPSTTRAPLGGRTSRPSARMCPSTQTIVPSSTCVPSPRSSVAPTIATVPVRAFASRRVVTGRSSTRGFGTPMTGAGVALGKTYPKPVVDHATARDRVLAAFKGLRE